MDLLLGSQLSEFFSHLEHTYNDGQAYRLHYVTAREAFNIAKAAEAGLDGNPGEVRDFLIPAYPTTPEFAEAAWQKRTEHAKRAHDDAVQARPRILG